MLSPLVSIERTTPIPNKEELIETNAFGMTANEEIRNFLLSQEDEIERSIEQQELTSEQKQSLDQLLDEYQDIFAAELHELGRINKVQHIIDTGEERPIKQRPYRATLPDQQFISEEIQRMENAGIIQPSTSPWASPIVIVSKKNEKKRLCIDYRKVNSITKKDAYPLPRIDEMLDALGNSKWFTSMDLTSGYWQIGMHPDSIQKTAFVSREGLYEFNVMPFGVCNGPATFQRAMDDMLGNYNWKFAMAYIDDINVFSHTFEEHLKHLQLVFR
jgi:hypothetical protein